MKLARVGKHAVPLWLVIVLTITGIGAGLSVYFFWGTSVPTLHALVALYPTAVSGHDPVDNTDQFLADLDLVKSLGFEGARLHQADYERYGYGRVADDLNDRGLKFVMVLHSWDDSRFPNGAYVSQLISYFKSITEQLRDKSNLLWYALDYPYDWNRNNSQLQDPNYHTQLQRIIDGVNETDPNHKIYLISGMIEDAPASPPTDFDHVDGFGIMPYSKDGTVDEVNTSRIQSWLDGFKDTGKPTYIAEWGVQTMQGSPNRTYGYGLATNETMKVKMIQQFISHIHPKNIYWDYFGLYDFPNERSDWGIAYDNGTLKPSGETIQHLLTSS
jgi:hypothetical protein